MSMMFDERVLPVCNQGYSIAREAVVSLSLLVDGILCSLLSDGLSLSLHLSLRRFNSVSVWYGLWQYWLVKCSFNRKLWLKLLAGYDGVVWVLGRVLFDLSYSLDHNPYPIGRTTWNLRWYLQVSLDQCF